MTWLGLRSALLGALIVFLAACTTTPPAEVSDVCQIFREKTGWYEDAKKSRARWGVPVSVSMAFMHQEFSLRRDGQAAAEKLWGVIPGLDPLTRTGIRKPRPVRGSGTSAAPVITVQIAMISVTRSIS